MGPPPLALAAVAMLSEPQAAHGFLQITVEPVDARPLLALKPLETL